MSSTHSATIYHNPRCGTSRTALQALQDAGYAVTVIEYLKTPPSRQTLAGLIRQSGLSVRDAIRSKEPLYQELGLDDPQRSDDDLLDAMVEHPILINRPFVVTEKGARLCRPAEVVQQIL
ncbi:arsenate reductase (glutaredoxin) [Bordetella holmesii]|uniref:Arsenate reductase n=2 Tax=Bordetella holmesii TaxID=35814 RepID=A0A158M434_9BORD|nr:arsenate reductase (glutaredoxin) [Bordetella holmesii]AHV92756.1 arsenate reductase [Bordetella holmesii ATCC 51541]AIT28047.1 arsenate reductase [Bordetella holmesii 44057]EWM40827.1 arsenate reductase [Bordetella holmesii 35009]EWM43731.1 arsenate reductase [Bordetella holmesii 41130]EWM44725.1 arsenate reductase [Bordetella holmesii 70147]